VAATHETLASRWLRRAVTVPGTVVLCVLDLALLPMLLVGALALDLVRRRPLVVTRFHVATAAALVVHVLGLVLLLGAWVAGMVAGRERERQLDYRIAVWLANAVWQAAQRLYGMRTEVEGAEALTPAPFVLMSRHASLLDTLLPLVFVARPHGWVLRYVVKRELLWDPVIDIVGHHSPMVFVRRGKGEHGAEIALVEALARHLGAGDAIAIFPEGTRFTPTKQGQILDSLAAHDEATFEHAQRLKHLLPPHPGGPLAVLDHTDVIFCAHTGLEGANHLRDLVAGALIGATVQVRYWRVGAAEIPSEPEARMRWLQQWWERLDAWIDEHLQRRPASP